MVDVAQLVEPRVVVPVVVGSSPIVHPRFADAPRAQPAKTALFACGLRSDVCRNRRRRFRPNDEGPLAQLVEQETLNLLVEGSSPSRPTTFSTIYVPVAERAAALLERQGRPGNRG